MNFTGENAGAIATAFIGAWATATAFWFGVGAIIWKHFFNPRIKALEDQLQDERDQCDKRIDALLNRVNQLETALMIHGSTKLREALSEGKQ